VTGQPANEPPRPVERFLMSDLIRYDDEHPFEVMTVRTKVSFRRELVRCDECGKPADAVHFLTERSREQASARQLRLSLRLGFSR
jgi:hypothetical protein